MASASMALMRAAAAAGAAQVVLLVWVAHDLLVLLLLDALRFPARCSCDSVAGGAARARMRGDGGSTDVSSQVQRIQGSNGVNISRLSILGRQASREGAVPVVCIAATIATGPARVMLMIVTVLAVPVAAVHMPHVDLSDRNA